MMDDRGETVLVIERPEGMADNRAYALVIVAVVLWMVWNGGGGLLPRFNTRNINQ
jgi:hypothetical protein